MGLGGVKVAERVVMGADGRIWVETGLEVDVDGLFGESVT